MSRKVRDLAQRQQSSITVLTRRSWAPEIAGFCLLTTAILSTAGVLA